MVSQTNGTDFVMEICDGTNSTKTLFPAFICRNDFMVRAKTEWECVPGAGRGKCVCWIFYDQGCSNGPMGQSFDWASRPVKCSRSRPVSRVSATENWGHTVLRVCVDACVSKNDIYLTSHITTDMAIGSSCHRFEWESLPLCFPSKA